jgi:preprotein translocase subunit SecE
MANLIRQTQSFTAEVSDEMKKVTWPDWDQLRNSTFVVLIFVVIVSAIIWLMDQVVNAAVRFIINMFTG